MRIDLHTHSSHSDGTQSPAEVMQSAAEAGLSVVALTDHDVSTGWAEADQAAAALGVSLVPGIEVSCAHYGISVHVLAYLLDPHAPELLAELSRSREHRLGRMREMVRRMAADGFPIRYEDVVAQARDGATLGRPHLADALVAAGCFPDRQAAFDDVVHSRSPYYVAHYAPHPTLAVQLILAAGGVPVMAHPLAAARGHTVGDDVIGDMVDAGLVGLEVDHRDHDGPARQHVRELCRRWGLLETGSSDYHGTGKPNLLGENTTKPEVLAQIVELGTGSAPLGAPLPS